MQDVDPGDAESESSLFAVEGNFEQGNYFPIDVSIVRVSTAVVESSPRTELLPEVKDIALQDLELVRRVRDGDNAAFAELYTKHKQGVYLYCTRFLGAGPAAEDIFQDVFMKCLEYLRKGKDIQNVKGYLLSSAHNRCLNAIRNRKYPKDVDEMSDYLSSGDVSYGETQDLQEALQQLAAENREALVLREYQGYSYEEISQLTSVPVTTVTKRIYRARKKLREILR